MSSFQQKLDFQRKKKVLSIDRGKKSIEIIPVKAQTLDLLETLNIFRELLRIKSKELKKNRRMTFTK